MSQDTEREAFEAWCLELHEYVPKWTGARYRDDVWEDIWQAWQARAALASQQAGQGEPSSKWEGGEGWESLAWELCADEHGEEACTELIWEGGPIPEPWGDRWMKYEDEAKRLIALVQKHTASPPPREPLTEEQIEDCIDEANRLFNQRRSGPHGQQMSTYDDWKYWLVRAIEGAHGIHSR